MKTIPSAYESDKYEKKIYQIWEKAGVFKPKVNSKKKPFVISMPPPNATGTLHLGHAVMLALEDIMIRYHRLKGHPALWVPGTDHASIATQNKVEQLLAKEGKTRHDLGREAFLEKVHEFVKNSQHIIRNQIRKMGSSCDWSRERYTLDKGLTEAVQEVFVRMYKDGLIYRGNRIVNWCPRCSSTLADDEVNYKEEKTKFYYLKYGPFTIGTARPETKFQDKIIVVHPDDPRYKKYHGKEMMVEWIEGQVKAKILADKSVDPTFGSGAMTITPAHDFNDFEIAKRHKLEIVQIIDEKGKLTNAAGNFYGMDAREARPHIIGILKNKGLVEKIDENYTHNLSVCYRCSTPIEPLVSKQWFVDVNKKFRQDKSLKQMAIEVVRKGEINILPHRFNKTYYHWMENLHDWCISRQIWFGHRIPAWYCKNPHCKRNLAVSRGLGAGHIPTMGPWVFKESEPVVPKKANLKPTHCPDCKSRLEQDPDTLDTWFSAGLWTFSTLGWPKKSKDLQYFHPTSVLETGYDILFFWVARMIIMSTYALNEVPFKTVYLHGLVRTRTGEKMSKSKPETCIDPLDMIQKYGADALRLSMVIGSGPGNDLRLYEEKIAGYRNFINKIWNACRFALLNVSDSDFKKKIELKNLSTADKWILSRAQKLISEVSKDLDKFAFSEAGMRIYDFTWNEFCDWYLEMSKVQKNPAVLLYVTKTILTLLHPFVPYVTEVLWGYLNQKTLLIAENWPKSDKKYHFSKAEKDMQLIRDLVSSIRSIRSENKVEANKKIPVTLYAQSKTKFLNAHRDILSRLAGLSQLTIEVSGQKISQSVSKFTPEVEIYVPLAGLVDMDKEKKRMLQEIKTVSDFITSLEHKLKNQDFLKRAPKEIVEREKERLEKAREQRRNLEKQMESF